jgi:ribosomal protein L31
MTQPNSLIKAYLCVVGYPCEHSKVEDALGLKADEKISIGDPLGKSKIKAKDKSCSFYTGQLESLDLDDHVTEIRKKFKDVNSFKQLPPETEVVVICVVYLASRDVSLSFSKENISFISSIRGKIEIDYYS